MGPSVELLEQRFLLSATKIWDRLGQLVVVNEDALPGAAPIRVRRNGEIKAIGDQVVISHRNPSERRDYRQILVIDTNGVLRLRHLDSDMPPGTEDPFGTSIKLPPGLVAHPGTSARDFFLSVRVNSIDLLTSRADDDILILKMTGRPVNGLGQPAPAAVNWTLTLLPAAPNTTRAVLRTTVTFSREFILSATHHKNAEAFRVAMFSSSNNTNSTAEFPDGTHDADRMWVRNSRGQTLAKIDLTTAPRNALLLPLNSARKTGLLMNGWMRLDQIRPAPLNGDPPNIGIRVLAGAERAAYRAQAYITQEPSTDHNADNLGAWISRSFSTTTIAKNTRLAWDLDMTASD